MDIEDESEEIRVKYEGIEASREQAQEEFPPIIQLTKSLSPFYIRPTANNITFMISERKILVMKKFSLCTSPKSWSKC